MVLADLTRHQSSSLTQAPRRGGGDSLPSRRAPEARLLPDLPLAPCAVAGRFPGSVAVDASPLAAGVPAVAFFTDSRAGPGVGCEVGVAEGGVGQAVAKGEEHGHLQSGAGGGDAQWVSVFEGRVWRRARGGAQAGMWGTGWAVGRVCVGCVPPRSTAALPVPVPPSHALPLPWLGKPTGGRAARGSSAALPRPHTLANKCCTQRRCTLAPPRTWHDVRREARRVAVLAPELLLLLQGNSRTGRDVLARQFPPPPGAHLEVAVGASRPRPHGHVGHAQQLRVVVVVPRGGQAAAGRGGAKQHVGDGGAGLRGWLSLLMPFGVGGEAEAGVACNSTPHRPL